MQIRSKALFVAILLVLPACGSDTDFTGQDNSPTDALFLTPDPVPEGSTQTHTTLADAETVEVELESTTILRAAGTDDDGLKSLIAIEISATIGCGGLAGDRSPFFPNNSVSWQADIPDPAIGDMVQTEHFDNFTIASMHEDRLCAEQDPPRAVCFWEREYEVTATPFIGEQATATVSVRSSNC